MTFRALLRAAETNPGLLNTRLGELRGVGLIAHEGEGYLLTRTGRELLLALNPLAAWARRWVSNSGTAASRREHGDG